MAFGIIFYNIIIVTIIILQCETTHTASLTRAENCYTTETTPIARVVIAAYSFSFRFVCV